MSFKEYEAKWGKALSAGPHAARRPTARLRKAAPQMTSKHTIGETGTGKPVFANALPWNPGYMNFTRSDHKDASSLHDAKQDAYLHHATSLDSQIESKRGQLGDNYLNSLADEATQARKMATFHQTAAERHYQASQKRA